MSLRLLVRAVLNTAVLGPWKNIWRKSITRKFFIIKQKHNNENETNEMRMKRMKWEWNEWKRDKWILKKYREQNSKEKKKK